MVEFKMGDIAHISNGLRVVGAVRPDAQSEEDSGITQLNLKYGDELTVVKVYPSRDEYAKKHTGGAVYDVTFEQGGILYHIESIPQRNFCSKKGWETHARLTAELEKISERRDGK